MTREEIMRARAEDVRRLARFLRLQIDGMSDRQVRRLVWWRLRPRRSRGWD